MLEQLAMTAVRVMLCEKGTPTAGIWRGLSFDALLDMSFTRDIGKIERFATTAVVNFVPAVLLLAVPLIRTLRDHIEIELNHFDFGADNT